MTNEIVQFDMLKEPMAIGQVFAESGMFPDVKSQAQAVVKILAGKELGISPFEAMTNIYIVNTRLCLTSKIMSALIKKSLKYDYVIEALTDTECSIGFFIKNGDKTDKLGTSTFTFKDAAKAGLANKENWKNYPRNMLFSRALSNGVRWFCPDAVCGYTVEEMEDIPVEPIKTAITFNGETLNDKTEETVQQRVSIGNASVGDSTQASS